MSPDASVTVRARPAGGRIPLLLFQHPTGGVIDPLRTNVGSGRAVDLGLAAQRVVTGRGRIAARIGSGNLISPGVAGEGAGQIQPAALRSLDYRGPAERRLAALAVGRGDLATRRVRRRQRPAVAVVSHRPAWPTRAAGG